MTSVNVTAVTNTVTVTEGDTTIVTITTAGPQGIQGEIGPQGPQGIQGIQGIQGETGPAGPGVITGGTTNQVLAKASNTDYDMQWVSAGAGTVTSVGTGTGLTGGPITSSGTIDLADTAVTPGSYTSANVTVDAQGRITAASNGTSSTNLSYDAATRTIASDTGTDATLPLVTSSDAGLVPASGGGTTNFLRADGTFAAPPSSPPGGTSGQIQFNDGGSFGGVASSSVDVDGNVTLRTATVNAPSGYTGNIINATRTGDGSSAFSVSRTGAAFRGFGNGGNVSFLDYNSYLFYIGFDLQFFMGGHRFSLEDEGAYAWSSTTSANQTSDLTLYRDGANILALRGGVNGGNTGAGQTFRVYNTYTSSTNYERANLGWSGNVFLVGTEKGSAGGTARQLELQTDGTSKVAITTDGKVGIGTTSPSASLELDAPSGYTGNLLDLQVDGTSKFTVDENGNLINGSAAPDINGQTEVQSALNDELIIYDTSTSTNKKALVRDIGCQGMGGWGITADRIVPFDTQFANGNAATFTVDRIYYLPILFVETKTFNTVQVVCRSGASGGNVRVGLYTANAGPGSLLVDYGKVTVSFGNLQFAINQTIEAGWYWAAFVTDDSTAGFSRQQTFPSNIVMNQIGTSVDYTFIAYTHLYENLAGSANNGLPSTATWTGGGGNIPITSWFNV